MSLFKSHLVAAALLALGLTLSASAQSNLLITEAVLTITEAEFLEIYNPGASAVDLTNYYLADFWNEGTAGARYYLVVDPASLSAAGSSDFIVQFPAGATIAAGAYQTIAMDQASNFNTQYGFNPTYEIVADGTDDVGVPNMIETHVSTTSPPGLTNGDEAVMLFYWDGASDLVTDIDYLHWSTDDADNMDKIGASADGPDGDSIASSYLADTADQGPLAAIAAGAGFSIQRDSNPPVEGAQTSPGNGESGTDETSEDLSAVTSSAIPTPNAPAGGAAITPVNIAAFRAAAEDTSIYQITGVATTVGNAFVPFRTHFYLQDGSGTDGQSGVLVDASTIIGDAAIIQPGDNVTAQGLRTSFEGEVEMSATSVVINSSGFPPAPLVITPADLTVVNTPNIAGELVVVEGVTNPSSATAGIVFADVGDGDGLHILATAAVGASTFPISLDASELAEPVNFPDAPWDLIGVISVDDVEIAEDSTGLSAGQGLVTPRTLTDVFEVTAVTSFELYR